MLGSGTDRSQKACSRGCRLSGRRWPNAAPGSSRPVVPPVQSGQVAHGQIGKCDAAQSLLVGLPSHTVMDMLTVYGDMLSGNCYKIRLLIAQSSGPGPVSQQLQIAWSRGAWLVQLVVQPKEMASGLDIFARSKAGLLNYVLPHLQQPRGKYMDCSHRPPGRRCRSRNGDNHW